MIKQNEGETETLTVILMGVSGSGKSAVGKTLSQQTGWPFYDGDDFHPPENIEKMSTGIPLNDEDRIPWLVILHRLIKEKKEQKQPMVLACSALKKRYREILAGDLANVQYIHLRDSFDRIYNRMKDRPGHYMRAGMLQSQFRDLEEPQPGIEQCLMIETDQTVHDIVEQIINYLRNVYAVL